MSFLLETPRLTLSRFSLADAPNLLWLNGDPEVIRYTGDILMTTLEEAETRIRMYDQFWADYGTARFAVRLRENGAFIGWCGIIRQGEDFDLGYRLGKAYWGQGYATEACVAVLDWFFANRDIDTLIGHVEAENTASVRVFEKIGMQFVRHTEDEHGPMDEYILQKTDWFNLRKK